MSTALPAPCELCGWLAAGASALGFGSFGVPIKGAPVTLDPLVFQSYKTTICFLTSWLVLAWGEEFVFSPWGIVSGLFWVPGGVATVYAIQAAGLAVGIGIGSSFIVLVSFIWGIFVFQERVHSRVGASIAILCMMLGLIGMSYFSSPDCADTNTTVAIIDEELELDAEVDESDYDDGSHHSRSARTRQNSGYQGLATAGNDCQTIGVCDDDAAIPQPATGSTHTKEDAELVSVSIERGPKMVVLLGRKMSRRHVGMLSAMFTGCYGGSIMAPMRYAPANAKGTHFLISFAIGSAIINFVLWVLRYLYSWYNTENASSAYMHMPSFHIRDMWRPGLTCGLLWSFGNFFSLLSVLYLGEGVGYPLVQTSILISGLWGIFYFGEVRGSSKIAKWFASSLLTICGILLLSYEHHAT